MKRGAAWWRPAAMLLVAFLILALLVWTGRTATFDRTVLAHLRAAGKPGLPDVPGWSVAGARLLTQGGGGDARLIVGLFGALVLVAVKRVRPALALIAASVGGLLLVELLKVVVARARPEVAWRLVEARTMSFPSGHAAGAMLLYPLLGFLLGGLAGGQGARAGAFAGITFAIVVGLTRVLLGVHWASDVVGGWLLGGAIAWATARALPAGRRR